ncbi:MAG: phospholipid carrier-dependent glycosyltransferase, partial [Anaerolineales bacterium]|nr:phospholipid carrier-dependent glycosyltransferase [Anaerolineales bacterium]
IHLARWLSVLMGALAVLFTYLLALEIFNHAVIASEAKQSPIRDSGIASDEDRPRNDSRVKFLAASAGAVVAFVPQFLFVSSAVSNDSTIVATSAFVLWLILRLLDDRRQPTTDDGRRSAVILGVACGLAALAKVSGLGLGALAVLVFVWQFLRQPAIENRKPRILSRVLLFTFAFLLVAGWWYARNLILYGELTGTARMSEIFHLRAAPMPFDQLLVQLREVWETFWVGFGWGNIRTHPLIYNVIQVFVALGVIGWVLGIRNSKFAIQNSRFAILFLWLALMFAALIYWMQTTQAPHGRLFFPALLALAVLLVSGLAQFQIPNLRVGILILGFGIFLFALSALAPFLILQPAYAYPQTLSENNISQIPNRVDISYDDEIKLLGYDVSARRVLPGTAIELTLYWQSLMPMDEDYSIGIRVVDAQQHVIGTRNSYPGHGMLPTRLWYTGQIIRDAYWLPINADARDTPLAQIQIVVFERLSKRDLAARDPRGEIITPFIGQIEVAAK